MNRDSNFSKKLLLAIKAGKSASALSRKYFAGNFEVKMKQDRTPVTQADVECDNLIRSIILKEFPNDGFFGEETLQIKGTSSDIWLVDPIDGTKAFVRQYPFFSTQISLMRNGQIILGVSCGTMFDEIMYAEIGKGAWLNGKRIKVSDVNKFSEAAISTGNLRSLTQSNGWQALGSLIYDSDRIRGYGDFYHYHLLASGKLDAVIESDVNILDIAALSIIVSEAGGVFTDILGNELTLDTTSVIAANSNLHSKLVNRFKDLIGP